MIDLALKALGEIEWDNLAAAEAIRLRAALASTLARGDLWFAGLARDFGAAAPAAAPILAAEPPPSHPRATPEPPSAKVSKGRPRQPDPPKPVTTAPPVKKARGRPLAKPHIRIGDRTPKPPVTRVAPIAVGGADAGGTPAPAQLFQDSYVSRDGPLRPAELPPDHPRRSLQLESSVTPEVDMSDFHEVEAAMRAGKGKEIFQ